MKKQVTITIDEKVYEEFKTLTDKMAVNKSKFVENIIKEFIKNNQNEIRYIQDNQ
jgi:metal-responsive CopG/Arc/MetJ family transcriptional regulator